MPNKFSLTQARRLLPKRNKNDNKSVGGRSLIIAGSEGMFGAAVLAAQSASRVGSGYVIIMTDLKKFKSGQNPDFLTADWKRKKINELNFTAAAIGPGLGQTTQALRLLKQLIKFKIKNVVIDADSLNLCAKHKMTPLPASWIATPHEGELSRLLGEPSQSIKKNRISAVKKAQQKLGCIVLLKGNKTLVTDQQNLFEIQAGNQTLAKAGTGDVLTGMITGFLAQGLTPTQAACLGAFVHGYAADQWIKNKKDYLSLMPSDLVNELPVNLRKIRKK